MHPMLVSHKQHKTLVQPHHPTLWQAESVASEECKTSNRYQVTHFTTVVWLSQDCAALRCAVLGLQV